MSDADASPAGDEVARIRSASKLGAAACSLGLLAFAYAEGSPFFSALALRLGGREAYATVVEKTFEERPSGARVRSVFVVRARLEAEEREGALGESSREIEIRPDAAAWSLVMPGERVRLRLGDGSEGAVLADYPGREPRAFALFGALVAGFFVSAFGIWATGGPREGTVAAPFNREKRL